MSALAIGCVSNDAVTLGENLRRSPVCAEAACVEVIEGAPSAAVGLNRALDRIGSSARWAVLAHQDVYLPDGWWGRIERGLARVEGPAPGVIGVFGVRHDGWHVGRVWSSGLGAEIGAPMPAPAPAQSLDEMVLIVRTEAGLRFNEDLPGFHLYGTDLVQTALSRGLGAFVIEAPAVHNSRPVVQLDHAFVAGYRFMQRAWAERLPIVTCVVPITRRGWPLTKSRMKRSLRRWIGRSPVGRRGDAVEIARRLGYERAPSPVEQQTSCA